MFDQNYGGVVETFAAGTRTFTEDETVSATYRVGDPDNKVMVVEATGMIEKPEVTSYQYGSHAITDEASSEYYALKSSIVDLDAYVDQKVTLYGSLVTGYDNGQIEGGPPLMEVYQVEPASGPDRETVTATFELTVEGEPPAGTVFGGNIGPGPEAYGALLDQDGDGVYTTSLPVDRGAEREVWIEQATPLNDELYAPLVPSTIKDFGKVEFDEDKTFSTTISFKDYNGSPGSGGSGSGNLLSNASGKVTGLLPSTGGGTTLAMLGGGALLIAGGFVIHRFVR